MNREKNIKTDGAGRKYFSFFYNTLRLFEHMCGTGGRFSVRKLMRFNGVHMQRRDRVHESLGLLIGLGWVRAVPGEHTLYEATEEGAKAYPEAKRFLDFHDGLMFGKWGFKWHRQGDGDQFEPKR